MVFDSPIDALVALCVRRKEATELVNASWYGDERGCIVTTLHGGRAVAALLTPEGRWAACNVFLDELFATPQEASRRLAELLRFGRRGYVGHLRCASAMPLTTSNAAPVASTSYRPECRGEKPP